VLLLQKPAEVVGGFGLNAENGAEHCDGLLVRFCRPLAPPSAADRVTGIDPGVIALPAAALHRWC
jgi:hypothetical protein